MTPEAGPVATAGNSFRARAEARQRAYRADVLKTGWWKYGHWLDDEATGQGRNFVLPEAHQAARRRQELGKGVAERTFRNMLSSQAMCFNLFAPLEQDLGLATEVLKPFMPELVRVRDILIEYTPPKELFEDQSGLSGVDCDLLIEGEWENGAGALLSIETKFVEPEFSTCGFRKRRSSEKKHTVCPDDVALGSDGSGCLYASQKRYRYWEHTMRVGTLAPGALGASGCPFGGPAWQLWVNHTLVHAEAEPEAEPEAERRNVRHAVFALCAPVQNEALLKGGIINAFRGHLARPETFRFIALDDLISRIGELAAKRPPALQQWSEGLAHRYGGI
ncbi:MAG TPA: hypothetical protein VE057_06200 [Archangium sp.]|nr:hypothetical protein [Archangium sp.]